MGMSFKVGEEIWFNQGDRSLKIAFNMGEQPRETNEQVYPPTPFLARIDSDGKTIGCIEFSYAATIKGQVVYEATGLRLASELDPSSDHPLTVVTSFRQFPI